MDFYKLCKEGNINTVELMTSHSDINLGLWGGAGKGGHMNIIDRIFSKTTTRLYLFNPYIDHKREQLHNFTKLHESLIRFIIDKIIYSNSN